MRSHCCVPSRQFDHILTVCVVCVAAVDPAVHQAKAHRSIREQSTTTSVFIGLPHQLLDRRFTTTSVVCSVWQCVVSCAISSLRNAFSATPLFLFTTHCFARVDLTNRLHSQSTSQACVARLTTARPRPSARRVRALRASRTRTDPRAPLVASSLAPLSCSPRTRPYLRASVTIEASRRPHQASRLSTPLLPPLLPRPTRVPWSHGRRRVR